MIVNPNNGLKFLQISSIPESFEKQYKDWGVGATLFHDGEKYLLISSESFLIYEGTEQEEIRPTFDEYVSKLKAYTQHMNERVKKILRIIENLQFSKNDFLYMYKGEFIFQVDVEGMKVNGKTLKNRYLKELGSREIYFSDEPILDQEIIEQFKIYRLVDISVLK